MTDYNRTELKLFVTVGRPHPAATVTCPVCGREGVVLDIMAADVTHVSYPYGDPWPRYTVRCMFRAEPGVRFLIGHRP